jgi:hypothetical protein
LETFSFLFEEKKLSEMSEYRDFEYTSFLSPWHFDDRIPFLAQNLKWKYFDDLYITKLVSTKNTFGLVNSFCYIKPVNLEYFLIWVRGTTKIELFRIKDLKSIDNEDEVIKELQASKKKYFFNCEPIEKIEYFFDLGQTEIDFDFPDLFKKIDEIIQVNDMNEVYKDFKQEDRGSSAIVILNPINNKITLFPQDWYNQDETMDFGYQWIARADRNKRTGRIQIQGTRIGEFYLDETNRRLGW